GWLAAAVETVQPARLEALRGLGSPVLAITARRAETLRARAYDGDLARLLPDHDQGLAWMRAVADPSRDLDNPMKGLIRCDRGGDASPHRAVLALVKSAQLLPAAVMVQPRALPAGVSRFEPETLRAELERETEMLPVAAARLPLAAAIRSRLHVFR